MSGKTRAVCSPSCRRHHAFPARVCWRSVHFRQHAARGSRWLTSGGDQFLQCRQCVSGRVHGARCASWRPRASCTRARHKCARIRGRAAESPALRGVSLHCLLLPSPFFKVLYPRARTREHNPTFSFVVYIPPPPPPLSSLLQAALKGIPATSSLSPALSLYLNNFPAPFQECGRSGMRRIKIGRTANPRYRQELR